MASILIVEDEPALGRRLERALSAHDVVLADSAADGLAQLRESPPDLVLLDLRLPDASGLDVLAEIRAFDAGLPVVLMTAYSSVRDAVEAMRRGATDYLSKPLDLDKVRLLVDSLLGQQRRARELAHLRSRDRRLPAGFLSDSPAIERMFEEVDRLAQAGLPPGKRPTILITGETGTGKGVAARALHERLGGGPFLEVNCTAMPASLVETELFGHERGTFTGAQASRTGLFEAAEGGTIFLDEIGELPLELQAKFLTVLESKRIRRLGSTRDRPVDVQVMAATNRDLDESVAEGRFREDLLHRLQVLSFEIPPLRERKRDVPLLARHFCKEFGAQYRGRELELEPGAEAVLMAYHWPGNVRELRNVMERAVLLGPEHVLPAAAFAGLGAGPRPEASAGPFVLPEQGLDLEEHERSLIRQAMERTGGNRTRAAALLGLSRHALRYRLEKFGLDG